jgi:TonB family protein
VHGLEGLVRLRALVGMDGKVQKAVKIVSNLPDEFNREAEKAVFRMKFKPAMKDNQAVPYWVAVEVEFNSAR